MISPLIDNVETPELRKVFEDIDGFFAFSIKGTDFLIHFPVYFESPSGLQHNCRIFIEKVVFFSQETNTLSI